jgi:hypothetical protein
MEEKLYIDIQIFSFLVKFLIIPYYGKISF